MVKNTFKYKQEAGQNPNTGIVSFQHFNNEKIYSDIIVCPENNGTETEDIECYPVPAGVSQIDRRECYYPDASVAYIRILWKNFEPRRNVYNYEFIERILRLAKENGQTVALRLMPHSTRACDDVPDWLKEIVVCPKRPAGKRVKDSPNDMRFIKLFSDAVKKLGERFDENPILSSVDLTLPGAWGEGYKIEEFSEQAIREITDAYLTAFSKTQLIGQISMPDIIRYAKKYSNVGVRGDGFGEPNHIASLYPPRLEKLADIWKTAPVFFESYWWLKEWKRKGWDIDKMIQLSLDWHVSMFNAKSLPIPPEWKNKIDEWNTKIGYHFSPVSLTFPESIKIGEKMKITLEIENCGVAPCYENLPLILRLKNKGKRYDFNTGADIRNWMPGVSTECFCIETSLIDAGEYDIEFGIIHPILPVYFATDASCDDGFYNLGKTIIGKTRG